MAWPSGPYGNVTTHPETGDMLGMEARFFVQNGRHMVEFVWCEGWCNDVYVMPVSRGDHGFLFDYSRREGREGAGPEYHFVAWEAGKRLNIGAWEGREPLDEGKPQRLRKLNRPYAIPFAKVNGAR
ncbi:MAG: hypothetical protein ABIQ81_03430 [Novosphingobium sp.]